MSNVVRVACAWQDGAHVQHFSGRLERPRIFAVAMTPEATESGPGAQEHVAALDWNLADDMSGWAVPSSGTVEAPLTLYGAPKRAVRGHLWQEGTTDWREAPLAYAAIQFYPDSLEDCGWEAQATWSVPRDLPSGFYAAHLVTEDGADDFVPFFVRPAADGPASPVLVVASTATYFAYANSRFWWEDPIQEIAQDRLVELGAEEQYLVTHPELGLSNYDVHDDGTPVAFSSRRRPNLFMRPGHSRNESYASDLYILSWLDHAGIDYDVVTDEDLHGAGRAILDRYAVALSGSHPEYLSIAMFDAMSDWVDDGGRYIYLGGNGFTSCVTWSPDRPWLMENRTTGRMRGDLLCPVEEAHHQSDGTLGLWMVESGRSTGSLFGVDMATMGFDRSYPVSRSEASYAPELGFVFAGIDGAILGGRSMSGHGVIGQEWDNARDVRGAPGHHVLASSLDHSLIPSVLGADPEHHGDVVIYFHRRGVVFSFSSMAWAGALHVDGYVNDAERLVHNVVRRFLDPTAITPPPDTGGSRTTESPASV